ncbi:YqzH family protein [Metabacillus litoralis]|jgi:hypothetical protein|uniref:Uncharacterized protein n=3 Tax=Metabacillus TaxID=2675233 RepID=A0A179T072_9BACI|nr:YqzH family protein [Metabacillus litoralis]OAS87486.1 hypothetical protein A6K24_20175 [Metabacillus litoralis]
MKIPSKKDNEKSILAIARWKMENEFLLKMLKNSFLQYGRDLDIDPLSKDDSLQLIEKITNEKDKDTEWYEVVEDVVYSYLTNQE